MTTMNDLRRLCADAMAGTPHEDPAVTIAITGHLSPENREQAAKCYAAIIGERALPASFGTKLTQPPRLVKRHDTEQVRRNGVARRRLEEMKDARP